MRVLSDNIVQYTRYPNGFICFQERKYIDEAQFLACGGIQGCINAAKNLMTTKRSYVKALVYLDAAIHQVGFLLRINSNSFIQIHQIFRAQRTWGNPALNQQKCSTPANCAPGTVHEQQTPNIGISIQLHPYDSVSVVRTCVKSLTEVRKYKGNDGSCSECYYFCRFEQYAFSCSRNHVLAIRFYCCKLDS